MVMLRLYDGYEHTTPQLKVQVEKVQALLGIFQDGRFGPRTELAVKQFQKKHKLLQDGIVGPRTMALLTGNTGLYANEFKEYCKYRPIVRELLKRYTRIPEGIAFAIGLKESNWGLSLKPVGPTGTGDFTPRKPNKKRGPIPPDGLGFGRGLLQLDWDWHEIAQTGKWYDPQVCLDYGYGYLDKLIQTFGDLQKGVAAYNCGPGNIRKGYDVDFFTTGRDYSRKVIDYARYFNTF